ncbi:MAG: hypothetical protein IT257_07375 [Chitinophagaceae bacterium]|nr:hypothetical protein [Chitinophagaceae bacterium]
MQHKFLIALCTAFLLLGQHAYSQPPAAEDPEDKEKSSESTTGPANAMWNLDVLAAMDFPMADMAKRYGTSYRIGLGIKYKTTTNWIFGVKFEFITGNKMQEDSLLWNMRNSLGITNINGEVLNVGMFERGYVVGVQAGRIFPFLQANPNSGPMMLASVGFMQHKINFFDRDNSFPQLRDDYKKGYDRLTNGLYIEDFVGYNFHSKNKLINVYAGFNFLWGFTKVRRDFTFDLERKEIEGRNDLLVGFKLGWVVPIYKKKSEDTYY